MDHMQVPTSPLELRPLSPALSANSGSEFDEEEDAKKPKWYIQWLPLCILIVILLSPLPSTLYVLYTYHLLYLKSPLQFTLHLTTVSLLLFAAFSSLTVCVTRDPGPVIVDEESEQRGEGEGGGTADMGVREALMSPDFESRGGMERWCRKCWARKPERAHHCSHCGRCVLKMDHHCPWIGYKCIGHRTYPAFIHFLSSITLLALYVAFVSITALYHAFEHPFIVDETTVLNELFLACEGSACSLVVGSFLVYHFYLISTNQTTLEHLSPYLLLRSLPPLPPTAQGYRGHKLSEPPLCVLRLTFVSPFLPFPSTLPPPFPPPLPPPPLSPN
ncbi:hypothetical protein JAAARDRAFT_30583 [Jaapia argillacea MUCL 33604]|uniref:Palmitoyltransferase n=1 Tax=Jaapia argillacea MUCL 33604 TaxID=933084 RepID=A0A067Q6S7_9AGAM|nr:hypothetical protein JAAARDRAFT_30583 [Jaapia argillacea MUCL 33604]